MWKTFAILLVASRVYAEPSVIAVDGKDIYVDLGAKDGVGAGSELELLHEIVAKDPRTGASLRDHFALGALTVAKAGDAVCVAHADEALAKRVLAGDHVRLVSAKRAFVDPWAEQIAASQAAVPQPVNPSAPIVDHAALARDAWHDTLGQPPEKRIARWAELLEHDPQSPYRRAIASEIKSLQQQVVERDAALAKARSSATEDRSPRITDLVHELDAGDAPLLVATIDRAIPGQPIELAFLARSPATIGHAWLYVRPHGAPGYRRIELVRDGDAYLRAAIDGAIVHGALLEWYVEAAPPGGSTAPVIGSQQAPQLIAVAPVVEEAPIAQGRSKISTSLDYVDFQGKQNKGFDEYYQFEADFMYRFFQPIYSVRLGFGTLSGIGGPKGVIDAAPTTCVDPTTNTYACKRVSFNYVYTELEFRMRQNVALLVRPQAGLLTTDVMPGADSGRCTGANVDQCQFSTGFGARLRLRLGEELGTNLVIGAGFTRGVGTILEAAYHWLPAPVVPVQISVQVTDQPVPEDFGVRLIGDVGLRKLSWVYPSLRVSYQARDIVHSGVSGGLALNFDW